MRNRTNPNNAESPYSNSDELRLGQAYAGDFFYGSLEQPHALRTPHTPIMALPVTDFLADSVKTEVLKDDLEARIQS